MQFTFVNRKLVGSFIFQQYVVGTRTWIDDEIILHVVSCAVKLLVNSRINIFEKDFSSAKVCFIPDKIFPLIFILNIFDPGRKLIPGRRIFSKGKCVDRKSSYREKQEAEKCERLHKH